MVSFIEFHCRYDCCNPLSIFLGGESKLMSQGGHGISGDVWDEPFVGICCNNL